MGSACQAEGSNTFDYEDATIERHPVEWHEQTVKAVRSKSREMDFVTSKRVSASEPRINALQASKDPSAERVYILRGSRNYYGIS